MKYFHFMLFGLIATLGLRAQSDTNLPVTTEENHFSSAPAILTETNKLDILSDTALFQIKSNIVIYTGNVRVLDPRMTMTCGQLTVQMPAMGGHPEYIFAESNVVIDGLDKEGRPLHGSGDQAVYTYKVKSGVTNEVTVLRGDSKLNSQSGSIEGDPITWDMTRNVVTWSKNHSVINTDVKAAGTKTSTNGSLKGLSQTNSP